MLKKPWADRDNPAKLPPAVREAYIDHKLNLTRRRQAEKRGDEPERAKAVRDSVFSWRKVLAAWFASKGMKYKSPR